MIERVCSGCGTKWSTHMTEDFWCGVCNEIIPFIVPKNAYHWCVRCYRTKQYGGMCEKKGHVTDCKDCKDFKF